METALLTLHTCSSSSLKTESSGHKTIVDCAVHMASLDNTPQLLVSMMVLVRASNVSCPVDDNDCSVHAPKLVDVSEVPLAATTQSEHIAHTSYQSSILRWTISFQTATSCKLRCVHVRCAARCDVVIRHTCACSAESLRQVCGWVIAFLAIATWDSCCS